MTSVKEISIVILAYPGCTLLDLVGPHQTLVQLPGAEAGLYWKERGPILTDSGVTILADRVFEEAPAKPTVFMVPGGGAGAMALLQDPTVLDWVAAVGGRADWVTSVCSGALILGAAGLLEGYQATSHWTVKDTLTNFGAIPTEGRVVSDRNRMTGGGVTAGIDFGLTLAGRLSDDQTARAIQLNLEYAPEPPYQAGTPDLAGDQLTARVAQGYDLVRARTLIESLANS